MTAPANMGMLAYGMHGLGDSIMQRVVIRPAMGQNMPRRLTHLVTCYPELYRDFRGLNLVRAATQLRCQGKHLAGTAFSGWVEMPRVVPRSVRLHYGIQDIANSNIYQAIAAKLAIRLDWPSLALPAERLAELPDLPELRVVEGRPLAVVRPVTVRTEWCNRARNPMPDYLAWIAERLMATHHVLLLADLEAGVEDLVGELPPHHTALLHGELSAMQAIELVRKADVVVGGVGWIVPASLACGTKAVIVLGGNGACNAPERITDPCVPGLDRLRFIRPDSLCGCHRMDHLCNKTISNLPAQWSSIMATLLS